MKRPDKKIVLKSKDQIFDNDDYAFYQKAYFHHLLRIERCRAERSRKPLLMLLLDIADLIAEEQQEEIMDKLHHALKSGLRESDIRGWHDTDRIVGIILTEVKSVDQPSIDEIIRKLRERLEKKLTIKLLNKISISFLIYPDPDRNLSTDGMIDVNLIPDLLQRNSKLQMSLVIKRAMDIIISAGALVLFAPIFLTTAIAIKLTSTGPVFFRQERLGLNGKPFTFLKFRSMYKDNKTQKHKEYILKYIGTQQNAAIEPGVFKLKDDDRVTPIGRWLRRTSLDELPQLLNVLKGEMSLVGPRPPIRYEYDIYDIWHKRRLLSCKPGITGLWQVTGRSRTTFDDMVRLDLYYINKWSLALDIKILLKTPGAVIGGRGAY